MSKLTSILIDIAAFIMILFIFYCAFSSCSTPKAYNLSLDWYRVSFVIPVVVSLLFFVFSLIFVKDAGTCIIIVPASFMFVLITALISYFNFNSNESYIAAKLYNIPEFRISINNYRQGLDTDCYKNQYSSSCARLNNYIYTLDKNSLGGDLYYQVHLVNNIAVYFSGNQENNSYYYRIINVVLSLIKE